MKLKIDHLYIIRNVFFSLFSLSLLQPPVVYQNNIHGMYGHRRDNFSSASDMFHHCSYCTSFLNFSLACANVMHCTISKVGYRCQAYICIQQACFYCSCKRQMRLMLVLLGFRNLCRLTLLNGNLPCQQCPITIFRKMSLGLTINDGDFILLACIDMHAVC